MSEIKSDFLDILDAKFNNIDDLFEYLHDVYRFQELSGEFSVIGSINNLPTGKKGFISCLQDYFSVAGASDDLYSLYTEVEGSPVYSYVYLDDDAPVFITNANKTDQLPPTIMRFIRETKGVGRLTLSRGTVDEIRQKIEKEYENLLIPFFTAKRSPDQSIDSRHRPDIERSMQYRGVDGAQTYREMKYNYGVSPRIMTFENPNKFKFRVKSNGTFVHQSNGILPLWDILKEEIDRAVEMKESANTGSYRKQDSSFFGEDRFSISTPWAIEVEEGITAENMVGFESNLSDSFWEFSVSEYKQYSDVTTFEAEIIDIPTNQRTTMKSKGNDIRVFQRSELTDIDQSLRIFNFVSDQFDSNCEAKQVS